MGSGGLWSREGFSGMEVWEWGVGNGGMRGDKCMYYEIKGFLNFLLGQIREVKFIARCIEVNVKTTDEI